MRCLACMILVSLVELSAVKWNEWGEWTNFKEDCFKRSRNCSVSTDDINFDVTKCCYNDCRSTKCNGENEVCETIDGYNYFCYCASNYFLENGMCTDCDSGCNDFKECRNYYGKSNCECLPNFFLVDEKCTAGLSKWSSWNSWIFENDNPNVNRNRKCILFNGNANQTQDCMTDYLSEWSSWSDCSNASNRTRNRTCDDTYFGKNCTGSVAEQTQSCPGFANTHIIILLKKTWKNKYLNYFSTSYKDLLSWFSNFTIEFENWFKRFTPLLFNESNLFIKKYLILASFQIAYSVDPKNLTRNFMDIESSLISQNQIMNCNISFMFIAHSDCCFSTIYDPLDAFMIEYFTGLEYLNFSLANAYLNLSCNYDESKIVNAYCLVMNSYGSWFTPETFSDMAMWSYDEIYECPAENEFSQHLLNLNKSMTNNNTDVIASDLSSVLIKNTNITMVDFQFITDIISRVVQASSMSANRKFGLRKDVV
ncbi:uncharacterized protein LOC136085992 isoform X2 [Hydra vulgaris]|uniref:Uncharacterized protein LOC136085992 isoform X2 n=1 Tax=Hydra vulgaris TaxID=6087 RepID=A0ABM4CQQ0_HYDVU